MRIFIAQIGNPEELLKEFKENTLNFLYHQEDRLEYRIKTVSYLIDEIQKLSNYNTFEELYEKLSKNGKRRCNTILNQLNFLLENR